MIKRTLCFSNPAYLSLRNSQLVLKFPGAANSPTLPEVIKKQAEITVPIEDIGIVVLDNKQITITQGLMEKLLENNCAVITCNNSHLPVGLLLPLEGNTTQSERFRCQIESSLPLKKQLWQQTVRQKILNQAAVLEKYSNEDHKCMRIWANEVRSGDADNTEARAAAYYWKNTFKGRIDGFVRDREGVAPNNFLNYGYAILRAVIARSLVASGLLPTLGIHHHNRYNAYCLADDIMEPYRPYVDDFVLEYFFGNPQKTEIDTDCKAEFLKIPTIDVTIDGKRSPLMIAATTTTSSLYKCFSGELRKISYPELPCNNV